MEAVTFKSVLESDVDNVFFNPDEFGEDHIIDGVHMTAIVDEMEQIEREKKMKSKMDALFVRQVLLYVKASEFGPLPAQGRIVTLDGKKYTVVDATGEGRLVYSIILEANRSR